MGNDTICSCKHTSLVMMDLSVSVKRDNVLLLSANNQLEQLYYQQQDPCIALHISRNYNLLQEKSAHNKEHDLWQEKAKLWWQLYLNKRANNKMALFFDESGLFNNIQIDNLNKNRYHLDW